MEFYPGFEVQPKRKYKKKMSDSITKYKEMEEAKSYSGLGEFPKYETTTTMTKNRDVKPQLIESSEELFRKLLDSICEWNESWRFFNESGVGGRPMNADEYASELSKKFKLKRK